MSAGFDCTHMDPRTKQDAMVFAGGERYTPNGRIALFHSDVCPPLTDIPHNCEDLTGRVVGRFTVAGRMGSNKRFGSVWAVRCACGQYESRSSKAIKNPQNSEDRCHVCRHVAYEKRSYDFHKHRLVAEGRKP